MRWALTFLMGCAGSAVLMADEPAKPAPKAAEQATFELRLADGSTLKAAIADEKIEIQTRYGKLTVPLADVQKIEFGPRLSAEGVKKLEAAVSRLTSPTESIRESAISELLKAGVAALGPLTQASKGPSQELAAKSREMLEKIRENLGSDKLPPPSSDMIFTEHFTIVGKIETTNLNVRTGHFGELTLRVPDLRSIRAPNFEGTSEVVHALPDPGNMTNYNNQIGKSFYFTVTGSNSGSLYGTGVHTTDSNVATAAVHAGILKMGQSGTVKVTILASPLQFVGSTQNGITSSSWGQYTAAYKVAKP